MLSLQMCLFSFSGNVTLIASDLTVVCKLNVMTVL